MSNDKFRILFLVLMIILTIFFTLGFLVQEPTIEAREINATDISSSTTNVNIKVIVNNTNPIDANLDKINYNVYILNKENDWKLLGSGERNNLSIDAYGSTTIIMPLKINNMQAVMVTFQRFFEDSTTLKVNGTAAFDLRIVSFEMPFENIIKIPKTNTNF